MTRTQFIQQAYAIYQEKELECSAENLQVLQSVARYLAHRGIPLSREILDFTIDVLQVKSLLGVSAAATGEDIELVRSEMVEWLEALGWRRTWFNRPLDRAS
jgi:hypothetical protein